MINRPPSHVGKIEKGISVITEDFRWLWSHIWPYHPVYASIINWHGSVITDMRRHSNFDFSDTRSLPLTYPQYWNSPLLDYSHDLSFTIISCNEFDARRVEFSFFSSDMSVFLSWAYSNISITSCNTPWTWLKSTGTLLLRSNTSAREFKFIRLVKFTLHEYRPDSLQILWWDNWASIPVSIFGKCEKWWASSKLLKINM